MMSKTRTAMTNAYHRLQVLNKGILSLFVSMLIEH